MKIARILTGVFITLTTIAVIVSCGSSQNSDSQTSRNSTGAEIPENAVRIGLGATLENVTPDTIHLNNMNDGEVVSSNFVLHNKSTEPIVIIGTEAACGCSQANFETKPIMPNEERLVSFTFDSKNRRGYQLKYFDFTLSNGKLRVYFDAEVR